MPPSPNRRIASHAQVDEARPRFPRLQGLRQTSLPLVWGRPALARLLTCRHQRVGYMVQVLGLCGQICITLTRHQGLLLKTCGAFVAPTSAAAAGGSPASIIVGSCITTVKARRLVLARRVAGRSLEPWSGPARPRGRVVPTEPLAVCRKSGRSTCLASHHLPLTHVLSQPLTLPLMFTA